MSRNDATIAVMQPYWLPYTGYFRLMEMADIFVILDDVQFPRRGYVHRNNFLKKDGTTDWLTLPIEKCARDTLIKGLYFHRQAAEIFSKQVRKFQSLDERTLSSSPIAFAFSNFHGLVIEKLVQDLNELKALLGISCEVVKSSEQNQGSNRGQEKIIGLVKDLGGGHYVNSPGGVDLYDAELFSRNNLQLSFLKPFVGSHLSIAQEILSGKTFEQLNDEISSQLKLVSSDSGLIGN